MAESETGESYEGRELHVDARDLHLPKVVRVTAEGGRRWAEYLRQRPMRAGTSGAPSAQPVNVQTPKNRVDALRLCVVGKSHLAFCTAVAAAKKGFTVYPKEEAEKAELLILAEDVETDSSGHRDLRFIKTHCIGFGGTNPIVLSSQVPVGFTRSLGIPCYHQPEQLRILNAIENACNPPRIVVGCAQPTSFEELPAAYRAYLMAFDCPVLLMSYEEAEFSKIAINMWLAAQVDCTNRLAAAAAKVGASWERIAEAMRLDPRIGSEAYLKPGCWQDSLHLLRDHVTLTEIEREGK